jgi:FkbM family methyltransferase
MSLPTLRSIRGAYGRRRRALRQAMLEPLLVGWPMLRQVVMNALAARGHLVLCDLGDARFFADPSDRVVGSWLIWHGGWQRREIVSAIEILSAAGRLPPDAVFVDVGAHIGTHTVYALRTKRFARAVAFEPAPRNAQLLAMNLEINKLAQSTVVVIKAAGDAAGTAVLHLHPRNSGAHAIGTPPSVDGREHIETAVVRVDDELACIGIAPDQIGLIWVDVEGYEPHALAWLAKLIEHSVPIAFEFTPSRYSADTKRRLVELLAPRYQTVHSLGRSDPPAPVRALASRTHTDDLLVC